MLNLCSIVRNGMKLAETCPNYAEYWYLTTTLSHSDCSQHEATLVDYKYVAVRALYYVSLFWYVSWLVGCHIYLLALHSDL